ncbi:MAG: tetratricopeptide repeat protein [Sphingomonas sp.]
MPGDEDIGALLPRAPEPRAERREAALAAAMRRFDGLADPDAAPAEVARPANDDRPWWRLSGPQAGVAASILLVALVGIPVTLMAPRDEVAEQIAANRAPAPAPRAVDAPSAPAVPQAAPAPQATEGQADAAPERAAPRDPAPAAPEPKTTAPPIAAKRAPPAPMREEAIAPPAAVPSDAAPVGEPRPDSRVMARRAPPRPAPANDARMAAAAPNAEGAQDIVVTGQRVARERGDLSRRAVASVTALSAESIDPAPAARRGDWNACTIDDPARSLRNCRRAIDADAGGAKGEAAAALGQGLTRAWQGEWRPAIAAFDRAIARDSGNPLAWLNRGLAHRRSGNPARARADLDEAIRLAPRAARGWYARSLLRRDQGDAEGARQDAARAIQLNRRYAALLD